MFHPLSQGFFESLQGHRCCRSYSLISDAQSNNMQIRRGQSISRKVREVNFTQRAAHASSRKSRKVREVNFTQSACSCLIKKILAELNKAPDKAMFPKSNAR